MGNDGTSFPWDDTAQLDYLNRSARSGDSKPSSTSRTNFPSFALTGHDAGKKSISIDCGFPDRGPAALSRQGRSMASPGLSRSLMPVEFWREVVDRVAVQRRIRFLLAKLFWLLKGI